MRPRVRVVAVSTVKNEEDVVEAFVRHTVALVDRLVVVDNASTDGTLQILRALEQEGLPLAIESDPEIGFYQWRRSTRLMRHAVDELGADWVMPLDADELAVFDRDALRVPPPAPDGRPQALKLPWRTFTPDPTDSAAEPNPFLRIRHRLVREPFPWVKVVVPAAVARLEQGIISQGSHAFELEDRPLDMEPVEGGYLAHFPFRSPGQQASKITVTTLQTIAMTERDPNWGMHIRAAYETLRRDPAALAASFYELGLRFGVMPDVEFEPETTADTVPYRGGRLRHTRPFDDGARAFTTLLAYAEELARRYARALARLEQAGVPLLPPDDADASEETAAPPLQRTAGD